MNEALLLYGIFLTNPLLACLAVAITSVIVAAKS